MEDEKFIKQAPELKFSNKALTSSKGKFTENSMITLCQKIEKLTGCTNFVTGFRVSWILLFVLFKLFLRTVLCELKILKYKSQIRRLNYFQRQDSTVSCIIAQYS